MPWIKYFCKNRNTATIGRIPIKAAAAAPLTLAESAEKKPAMASVIVLILGDWSKYKANW